MILIVLETLMLKGGIAIGHWFAAHGTSAMAAKGGAMVAKGIATQGLMNTLANVTGLAAGSSLVVGGCLWTTDKVKILAEALTALNKGDCKTFCIKCAKLCTLFHVEVEFLPDIVEKYLIKAGFSMVDASNVAKIIADLEYEILKFMGYR
jgi:hypothetical protein